MSESLIGRKVRLTGRSWDKYTYEQGSIRTITHDKGKLQFGDGRCVGIAPSWGTIPYFVAIDNDADDEVRWDWFGELLPADWTPEPTDSDLRDWQYDVASGDTLLGLREWTLKRWEQSNV